MSRSGICIVDPAGTLVAMPPSEPCSEDFMQKLVASHPELIADHDGTLLLIHREQPIADREDGSGRWSLLSLHQVYGIISRTIKRRLGSMTQSRLL